MSCVMYDTPAGTFAGREHCLGHLDQMGNVYDVPVGVSAGQNHIVGHVTQNGEVYDVPSGVSAGVNHMVGYVDASGNVFRGRGAMGIGNCVGHITRSGNVYDVPVGGGAGRNHIVGHIEGQDGRRGAAALLLLLRPQGSSGGYGGSGGAGGYGGPASGGGGSGYGGGSGFNGNDDGYGEKRPKKKAGRGLGGGLIFFLIVVAGLALNNAGDILKTIGPGILVLIVCAVVGIALGNLFKKKK